MAYHEESGRLHMAGAASNALTREHLRAAMCRLLAAKDKDGISVTELAREAGVSRNAFYRNYGSKEELIAEICAGITDYLRQIAREWAKCDDREAWLIAHFRWIKENGACFRILLDARRPLLEGIRIDELPSEDGVHDFYADCARIGAFVCLLQRWYIRGMRESPEEMGALCHRYTASIE